MAEVSLLVMFAIVVVSAIVIFKIVKGIIQTILLTSAVAAVVLAAAAGFVVMDALDLKDKLPVSSNALLLTGTDGKSLIGGIVMKGQETEPVAASELERLNLLFGKGAYEEMKAGNYKLIIIKEGAVTGSFDELPEVVNVEGFSMKREALLEQLSISSGREKAALLIALFSLKAQQDPLVVVSEYKKGNAIVYPETPVFKAIKVIPLSFFRKVAEKAFRQAADAGKGAANKAAAAAAAAAA
ncbi:hypothetical protein HYU16_01150 [Candidatus Woesearchaeota archaeon]|nr:hypothetical protein [Candidatus Woesearchaeota archaeon]